MYELMEIHPHFEGQACSNKQVLMETAVYFYMLKNVFNEEHRACY